MQDNKSVYVVVYGADEKDRRCIMCDAEGFVNTRRVIRNYQYNGPNMGPSLKASLVA